MDINDIELLKIHNDIDKLKSNIKWFAQNGGVGGSGGTGTGGGTQTSAKFDVQINITHNGKDGSVSQRINVSDTNKLCIDATQITLTINVVRGQGSVTYNCDGTEEKIAGLNSDTLFYQYQKTIKLNSNSSKSSLMINAVQDSSVGDKIYSYSIEIIKSVVNIDTHLFVDDEEVYIDTESNMYNIQRKEGSVIKLVHNYELNLYTNVTYNIEKFGTINTDVPLETSKTSITFEQNVDDLMNDEYSFYYKFLINDEIAGAGVTQKYVEFYINVLPLGDTFILTGLNGVRLYDSPLNYSNTLTYVSSDNVTFKLGYYNLGATAGTSSTRYINGYVDGVDNYKYPIYSTLRSITSGSLITLPKISVASAETIGSPMTGVQDDTLKLYQIKFVLQYQASNSADAAVNTIEKYFYINAANFNLNFYDNTFYEAGNQYGFVLNTSYGLLYTYNPANYNVDYSFINKQFTYTANDISNITLENETEKLIGTNLSTLNDINKDEYIYNIGFIYSETNIIGSDTNWLKLKFNKNSNVHTINLTNDVIAINNMLASKYSTPFRFNKASTDNYNSDNTENLNLLTIRFRKITTTKTNHPKYELSMYLNGNLEFFNQTLIDNESDSENTTTYPLLSSIVINNKNFIIKAFHVFCGNMVSSDGKKKDWSSFVVPEFYYKFAELCGKTVENLETKKKFISQLKNNPPDMSYGNRIGFDETMFINTIKQSKTPIIVFEPTKVTLGRQSDIDTKGTTSYDNNITDNNFFDWFHFNDGTKIGSSRINLYYILTRECEEISSSSQFDLSTYKKEINTGYWEIEKQGTSTSEKKAKNIELKLVPNNTAVSSLFFSPNYVTENKITSNIETPTFKAAYVPETSFTLKADVSDSSHSNNTACGKFVNTVTDNFVKSVDSNISNYTKNCLVGFPIIGFVKVKDEKSQKDVYFYMGVYNFNLGRESYNNLGYIPSLQIDKIIKKLDDETTHTDPEFVICELIPGTTNEEEDYEYFVSDIRKGLSIIEGRDKLSYYDYSQYDYKLLFEQDIDGYAEENMFTKEIYLDDGTKQDKEYKRSNIQTMMKCISMAGGAIFNALGKTFGSITKGYNGVLNEGPLAGLSANQVPDFNKQYSRSKVSNTWHLKDTTKFENLSFNSQNKLVYNNYIRNLFFNYTDDQGGDLVTNYPMLDYNSLSWYYTICMTLGLVDSVTKNLNLKAFDNLRAENAAKLFTDTHEFKDSITHDNIYSINQKDEGLNPKGTHFTYFVEFYDMDTCLGKDNTGKPTDYTIFSDYWEQIVSEQNGQKVLNNLIPQLDFQPEKFNGFDTPSTYLFALAKYLGLYISYFDADFVEQKNPANYNSLLTPYDIYGKLRKGELKNADNFVTKYFGNITHNLSEPLINLNYYYKYISYKNESNTNNIQINQQLNFGKNDKIILLEGELEAFIGTGVNYVKWWLENHLTMLDMYFNLECGDLPLYKLNDSKTAWETLNTNYAYKNEGKGEIITQIHPNTLGSFANGFFNKTNLLTDSESELYKSIFTSSGFEDSTSQLQGASRDLTITSYKDYSPFIIMLRNGATSWMYILPEAGTKYTIKDIELNQAQVFRYGSKWLTYIDEYGNITDDNYILNSYNFIDFNATDSSLSSGKSYTINAPNLETIILTGLSQTGSLNIDESFDKLKLINISSSKVSLTCKNVKSLTTVNLNGIANNGTTTITGCENLNSLSTIGAKFNVFILDLYAGIIGELTTYTFPSINVKALTLSRQDNYMKKLIINNNSYIETITLYNNADSNYEIQITNCSSLKNININNPETVTKLTINSCPKLSAENSSSIIDLSNFTSLTQINLSDMNNITEVKLPTGKTIEVTLGAFKNCYNLSKISGKIKPVSITLTNGNVIKPTHIFYNCMSLAGTFNNLTIDFSETVALDYWFACETGIMNKYTTMGNWVNKDDITTINQTIEGKTYPKVASAVSMFENAIETYIYNANGICNYRLNEWSFKSFPNIQNYNSVYTFPASSIELEGLFKLNSDKSGYVGGGYRICLDGSNFTNKANTNNLSNFKIDFKLSGNETESLLIKSNMLSTDSSDDIAYFGEFFKYIEDLNLLQSVVFETSISANTYFISSETQTKELDGGVIYYKVSLYDLFTKLFTGLKRITLFKPTAINSVGNYLYFDFSDDSNNELSLPNIEAVNKLEISNAINLSKFYLPNMQGLQSGNQMVFIIQLLDDKDKTYSTNIDNRLNMNNWVKNFIKFKFTNTDTLITGSQDINQLTQFSCPKYIDYDNLVNAFNNPANYVGDDKFNSIKSLNYILNDCYVMNVTKDNDIFNFVYPEKLYNNIKSAYNAFANIRYYIGDKISDDEECYITLNRVPKSMQNIICWDYAFANLNLASFPKLNFWNITYTYKENNGTNVAEFISTSNTAAYIKVSLNSTFSNCCYYGYSLPNGDWQSLTNLELTFTIPETLSIEEAKASGLNYIIDGDIARIYTNNSGSYTAIANANDYVEDYVWLQNNKILKIEYATNNTEFNVTNGYVDNAGIFGFAYTPDILYNIEKASAQTYVDNNFLSYTLYMRSAEDNTNHVYGYLPKHLYGHIANKLTIYTPGTINNLRVLPRYKTTYNGIKYNTYIPDGFIKTQNINATTFGCNLLLHNYSDKDITTKNAICTIDAFDGYTPKTYSEIFTGFNVKRGVNTSQTYSASRNGLLYLMINYNSTTGVVNPGVDLSKYTSSSLPQLEQVYGIIASELCEGDMFYYGNNKTDCVFNKCKTNNYAVATLDASKYSNNLIYPSVGFDTDYTNIFNNKYIFIADPQDVAGNQRSIKLKQICHNGKLNINDLYFYCISSYQTTKSLDSEKQYCTFKQLLSIGASESSISEYVSTSGDVLKINNVTIGTIDNPGYSLKDMVVSVDTDKILNGTNIMDVIITDIIPDN